MSAQAASENRNSNRKKDKSGIWLTEAQAALGWGVILALLAVLGAVYLYQASRTAGAGRRVQSLQNEIEDVRRVNAALEREIAEAQSLERLQADVTRLGFVQARPEDVVYIVVPETPSTITRPRVEPEAALEPIETINRAVWITVKTSLDDFIQGESR